MSPSSLSEAYLLWYRFFSHFTITILLLYTLIVHYLIVTKSDKVNLLGQFLVWRYSSIITTNINKTEAHHLQELPYLCVIGLGYVCQSSLQNNSSMAVVGTEVLFSYIQKESWSQLYMCPGISLHLITIKVLL